MIRRSLPIVLGGLFLAGVLVVVLLVTTREESTIARKVYFADNISAAHLDAIERFNREHIGRIEVVPVSLPFSKFSTNERKELLARSLRNKSDRIDIFSVDHIWVPRFSKWSEPMGAKFDSVARKTILPFALESCEYGDTLVAVPLYIDIGLMYYRWDLVRRLPDADAVEERLRGSMTWDEFFALGKRMGVPPGKVYAFQGDEYEGTLCNYFEFLVGRDSLFFHRDSLDFDSPAAHQALQDMVDLVYRHRVSPVRVTELDEIRSYHLTLDEDMFAVRGWPNFLESFNEYWPETRPRLSLLRRAALPHPAGGRTSYVYGGWNLMVTRNSANKAEAMEFIKFLQREDTQKRFFEIGGYLPTSTLVYSDSAYMARNPVLAYYRQLLDRGFHRPALPAYTQMSDILSHGIHRALLREASVNDALHEAVLRMRETHVLSKR